MKAEYPPFSELYLEGWSARSIVGIDGIWSFSYTFFPKRPPAQDVPAIADVPHVS